MTVVVVIFLPLVLAYQTWTYYVFRRRVSREEFIAEPSARRAAAAVPGQRRRPVRRRAPRRLRPPQKGARHGRDYDVIVIGTGAGGGTLARHLAPSGKRILLLERGDWLPREPANWSTADVFVDGRYISPDSWYDVQGQVLLPAAGALLRRRRHQAVRRRAVPDARGGLRRNAATTTGCRPPGPSPTRTWSRTTPPPSRCTRCTGRGGRIRPSRRPARPTRTPRSPTSRASSSCPMTWPSRATTRSTRRAASCSTRRTCPTASACAARTATASRARCTPSPTPR